jgi:hypothetical protein
VPAPILLNPRHDTLALIRQSNVNPIKYTTAFTMRADQVSGRREELRRLQKPIQTKCGCHQGGRDGGAEARQIEK